MFYIKAKVRVKIFGISYPQEHTVSNMINTTSNREAQQKFEDYYHQKFTDPRPESVTFEYIEIAPPIL